MWVVVDNVLITVSSDIPPNSLRPSIVGYLRTFPDLNACNAYRVLRISGSSLNMSTIPARSLESAAYCHPDSITGGNGSLFSLKAKNTDSVLKPVSSGFHHAHDISCMTVLRLNFASLIFSDFGVILFFKKRPYCTQISVSLFLGYGHMDRKSNRYYRHNRIYRLYTR